MGPSFGGTHEDFIIAKSVYLYVITKRCLIGISVIEVINPSRNMGHHLNFSAEGSGHDVEKARWYKIKSNET